jgi:hypothetical protein
LSDYKVIYQQLCETEQLPIFLQSWWLDAVCGTTAWQPLLCLDKAGKPQAAMIVWQTKKWNFSVIQQPFLTPFSGIWIKYPTGGKLYQHSKVTFEHEVLNDLIAQIPKTDFFQQHFHFSFENWLPFYNKRYKQTTRYTYFIENIKDLERVYADFKGSVRTNIKKAAQQVSIETTENVAHFFPLYKDSVAQNGERLPYDLAWFEHFDAAIKTHNCRSIYLAKDSTGNIHAAAYIVWDNQTAYFLASGINRNFSSSAMSLLIWQAIQDAAAYCHNFDFEGSMLAHIEPFFRSFGSVPKPYFQIRKVNSLILKYLYEK